MYQVRFYQSHPSEDNDDCITGEDYDSHEAAMAAFEQQPPTWSNGRPILCQWIVLDGPDEHLERRNPDWRAVADDDDDWRRERANQAGMAGGAEAFNDAMGWGMEEVDR